MKQLALLLSLLTFSFLNYGQPPKNSKKAYDDEKIYVKAAVDPSFPGGEPAWQQFVESNFDTNIPIKNGAPGGTYIVVVRFIVNRSGVVSDAACENDPGYGICQEAIRVTMKSGIWKPATQPGHVVNAFHSKKITFSLKPR